MLCILRVFTARELLTAVQLPGYSEGSGWVHFTQDGVLSWVGDGVKVQKKELSLSSASATGNVHSDLFEKVGL